MSKSRWTVRIVLVVVLLAVCAFAVRTWWVGQPGYYLDSAQDYIDAKDWANAKLELKNHLEDSPDDADAHALMATVLIEEAKAEGRPAGYAANPEALEHLRAAAEAKPDDIELQKQLLAAYLNGRQYDKAAAVARRVVKSEAEADNKNAHFALLHKAVQDKDEAAAEKSFAVLTTGISTTPFRTLVLMADLYDKSGNEEKLEGVFDSTERAVAGSDADVLQRVLSADEQTAMFALLKVAVDRAKTARAAHQRTEVAIDAAEKLVAVTKPDGGENGAAAGKSRPAEDPTVDRAATGLAEVTVVLIARHPVLPTDERLLSQRQELFEQADKIWDEAIGRDIASPVVFRQSALGSFARKEDEEGLKKLASGIQALEGRADKDKANAASWREQALELRLLAARQMVVLKKMDEAEQHIEVLLDSDLDAAVGWGHLLAGRIAATEGRLEDSLDHLTMARQDLGDEPILRIQLAHTLLALREWEQALKELVPLRERYGKLDEEQRAWAEQQIGTIDDVHFAELRARLALGEWAQAQQNINALKGTLLETRMWTLAIAFLATNEREAEAKQLLHEVRRKFPQDPALARLDVVFAQRDGDPARAEAVLVRLANDAPGDLASQLMLARWLLSSGKVEEGLQKITDLEKRFTAPAEKQALIVLKAQALMTAGRTEEALELVDDLRATPGSESVADVVEAAIEIKQQNWEKASELLATAAANDPRNRGIKLLQGTVSATKGDYAAAVDALAESLEVNSLRERARASLIYSILQLARETSPEEAQEKVDQLLTRFPEDPGLILVKADLLFQQNRLDEGMMQLDKLEGLLPADNPSGPYLKAMAWLVNRRNAEKALVEAKRAIERSPEHVPSLVLAAQSALMTDKYADALDRARALLKINRDYLPGYFLQAQALLKLERSDEAIQVLDGLTRTRPEMPAAWMALAGTYETLDRIDDAQSALHAGREKLPDEFALVSAEIGLLARHDRLEEAQQLAAESTGEDSTWGELLAIGAAFAGAKDLETARDYSERALVKSATSESDSPVAACHMQLGNISLLASDDYMNQEELAKARDHFQAVIDIEPLNYVAGNNLAWLLVTEFNEIDAAVNYCDQVRGRAPVEIMPPAFIDTLALVYRKANQMSKAQTILEQAIALHPDHPLINFQYGMLLAEQDRDEIARRYLDNALRLGLAGPQAEEARLTLSKLEEAAAAR